MKQLFILLLLICGYSLCGQNLKKINGACLVSPPNAVSQQTIASVKRINANWVAIVPYGFLQGHTPHIAFDSEHQWWGEKKEGVIQLIKHSQAENLNIMLKPHLWIKGDGWAGDFKLQNEADWTLWESEYTKYITSYAKIAEKYKLPLLCIGTEIRQVVKNRPLFWKRLIKNIRSIYNGNLTYASNWDNFENVKFWGDLDYIGIDAYFPLNKNKTPSINELKTAWLPIKKQLHQLSICYNTPILFTEYGYESCDYTNAGHWNNKSGKKANQQAQKNAYEALYQTFWNEDWVHGGFLWKWHLTEKTIRGADSNFTPQKKMVEEVIKKWY